MRRDVSSIGESKHLLSEVNWESATLFYFNFTQSFRFSNLASSRTKENYEA